MSKRKKITIISVVALLTIAIVVGILISTYTFTFLRIKLIGVDLKPTKAIQPFGVTYYLQNDLQWSERIV